MDADPSPLDQLAAIAGIEPDYWDGSGERRLVSQETKAALLGAMGLGAETDEAARASLRRLDEASWLRALPPVLVWRRRRRALPEIPVVLRQTGEERRLAWSIETEAGGTVQGETPTATLPLRGRRTIDGVPMERRSLALPIAPPLGYHRLRVCVEREAFEMPLIGVPGRCHLPSTLSRDGLAWGVSVQLYGLRSRRNWGIGDFGDLARLAEIVGRWGADAIGLNPLHALSPGAPGHASPYSPSSRLWLNVLYLDVPAVPDYADCAAARALAESEAFVNILAGLRDMELVDYAAVADAKFQILAQLYKSFRTRHLGDAPEASRSERGAAFRKFQATGGELLERHAIFEALVERFGGPRWRDWPTAYRSPDSGAVAEFATAKRDRIEYFQYLQWLADQQLRHAAETTRAYAIRFGFYHDLALATDANGADAWAQQGLYAAGVAIGAPPDAWNLRGQNWGMPPMNPMALRERGFAPFAAVVTANMRHGGALRIDHVMSLQRLFWIPDGAEAREGAYVRQPFDELLGIVALESQRQRCMVIGEDLGTVPPGFRARMHKAQVLSYRLLYFQRDARGAITPPARYPRLSAVTTGTHDLAPLPGFWSGRDLDVRAELGLYPSRAMEVSARAERDDFRRRLVAALKRERLLPASAPVPTEISDELVLAIYRHLGRTPGCLVMVHLEDALGVVEQTNLPGTTDEHPNWRRKLPRTIDEIARDRLLGEIATALREARPRRVAEPECRAPRSSR